MAAPQVWPVALATVSLEAAEASVEHDAKVRAAMHTMRKLKRFIIIVFKLMFLIILNCKDTKQ